MRRLLVLIAALLWLALPAAAQTVARDGGTPVAASGSFGAGSTTTANITVSAGSVGLFHVWTDFTLDVGPPVLLDGTTALTLIRKSADSGGHYVYSFKTGALSAGTHSVTASTDSASIGSVFHYVWHAYSGAAVDNDYGGNDGTHGSVGNEFLVSASADTSGAWLVAACANNWNGTNNTAFYDTNNYASGNARELGRVNWFLVYDSNGTVAAGAHSVGLRQSATDIGIGCNVITMEPAAAGSTVRGLLLRGVGN